VSRYPDAASAVPYELDEPTAQSKIQHAEVVIAWLKRKIAN
jgi:hypothetical protein